MNDALRAWRTILYVKQRARDRAEVSLNTCRHELQQRTRTLHTAEAERDGQKERRAAAKHTLDEALSYGPTTIEAGSAANAAGAANVTSAKQVPRFDPQSYLLHKAYMTRLDVDIEDAGKTCDAARRHVTHAQGQVDQAQKDLARAEASLKACSEKAKALKDKTARQIEEAADEASCETAAQRIYRMAHA